VADFKLECMAGFVGIRSRQWAEHFVDFRVGFAGDVPALGNWRGADQFPESEDKLSLMGERRHGRRRAVGDSGEKSYSDCADSEPPILAVDRPAGTPTQHVVP
jgi:hypothetical protein